MPSEPDPPADGWYIARNREQDGPFSATRLRQLAKQGWLGPDDLVWHATLPAWKPARDIDWLFGSAWTRFLGAAIPGLRQRGQPSAPRSGSSTSAPTRHRPARRRRRRRRAVGGRDTTRWPELHPRHLVAIGGTLAMALGAVFFSIASSPLARGLAVGGALTMAAACAPEIARLAAGLARRLERQRLEAQDRRTRRLADADSRLRAEDEARRQLAEQQRVAASWATPPQAERVVVVREPRVKRWNRWLAVLLSLVIPGLGQGYKGEVAAGVAWFVFVSIGYLVATALGGMLHACCIIGAATGDPWTEERTSVVRV